VTEQPGPWGCGVCGSTFWSADAETLAGLVSRHARSCRPVTEQHAGEAMPMMEPSPFDGSTPEAVELWDAINRYASGTRLSVQRQIAVAEISSLIRAAWNRRAPALQAENARLRALLAKCEPFIGYEDNVPNLRAEVSSALRDGGAK
jgi:hypothetical protein